MPRTLFQKVWDEHVVSTSTGQPPLLYVDLHLVHEVTSPQAFDGLRVANRKVREPLRTIATVDHNIPTEPRGTPIFDPIAKRQIEALQANCRQFGVRLFDMDSPEQGIVHVIGPELGFTQPGMIIVCGDSHTSTHGAFGALAFGIGTSEVEHVLATQCLPQRKPKTMLIHVSGRLGEGVSAKDLALGIIGKIGTDGATGHVIEYAGEAVRSLSVEGRMTLCNMSIEAGARAGMVAPDETTFAYEKGRRFAPQGADWEAAVTRWRTLPSDPGAKYDTVVEIDASELAPFVAARVAKGYKVASGVRAMVVPGSQSVKHAAEQEGLHNIFQQAGFEWRESGCSMCLGMNPDILRPAERCASTSNRNFEGRQGRGGRTHLVSPMMAAAAAITGHFTDIRNWQFN